MSSGTSAWRLVLLGLAGSACIDFGYEAPPFALAGEQAPDDSGACVEGPTAPRSDGAQVRFVAMDVDAPIITVAVGEVVTWTNYDTMPHDVTAGSPGAPLAEAAGGFYSGVMQPGAAWAYRFCAPRDVVYFCDVHKESMFGYQVSVE